MNKSQPKIATKDLAKHFGVSKQAVRKCSAETQKQKIAEYSKVSQPSSQPARNSQPNNEGQVATRIPRDDELTKIWKELDKKYGCGMPLKSGETKISRISTGIEKLDKILGGGIPRGRSIEIFGTEHSGKTTLSLHMAKEFQKSGEKVLFIDVEQTFDDVFAEKLGLDMNMLDTMQELCAETIVEIIRNLSHKYKLIIVDSIAGMHTRAEINGESGDSNMGGKARVLSQGFRLFTGVINRNKCTVIFLNQIRKNIGVVFGNPEFTPGGMALKFHATQRIEMRKQAGKDNYIPVKVKIVKNKAGMPNGRCELKLSECGFID